MSKTNPLPRSRPVVLEHLKLDGQDQLVVVGKSQTCPPAVRIRSRNRRRLTDLPCQSVRKEPRFRHFFCGNGGYRQRIS